MIKFDYLEFDDSYALAVKCIWALGEIGSPEAIDVLFDYNIGNIFVGGSLYLYKHNETGEIIAGFWQYS